jgi:hypothetical protein
MFVDPGLPMAVNDNHHQTLLQLGVPQSSLACPHSWAVFAIASSSKVTISWLNIDLSSTRNVIVVCNLF